MYKYWRVEIEPVCCQGSQCVLHVMLTVFFCLIGGKLLTVKMAPQFGNNLENKMKVCFDPVTDLIHASLMSCLSCQQIKN